MNNTNENQQSSISQNKAIREHLMQGYSITPLDALNLFGSFRLSARIKDLRDSGMAIETEMVTINGKRVAKYTLKH